jgi:hypothetical protein
MPAPEECPQGRQIRAQKVYPATMTDCEVLDRDTQQLNEARTNPRQSGAPPATPVHPTPPTPQSISQEQLRWLIEQRDKERASSAGPGMLISEPPASENASSHPAPIFTNDLHNVSDKTTGFDVVIVLAVGLIYFLPSLMAAGVGHHNRGAIFALNLFLGWSFLGWVAAFVWACTQTQKRYLIEQSDVLVARREPRL